MGNYSSVEQPRCDCTQTHCSHDSAACKNAASYDPTAKNITVCAPCLQARITSEQEELERITAATGPGWKQTRCPCVNMHGKCEHSQRCWTHTSINIHNNPALCDACRDAVQGVVKAAKDAECDRECAEEDDENVEECAEFDE